MYHYKMETYISLLLVKKTIFRGYRGIHTSAESLPEGHLDHGKEDHRSLCLILAARKGRKQVLGSI